MFFMQDNDFTLFGASPESSLKYDAVSRQIEIYPIAGTRPRGGRADGSLDRDLDSRIELEMRTDQRAFRAPDAGGPGAQRSGPHLYPGQPLCRRFNQG